jgi:hypothetical protein
VHKVLVGNMRERDRWGYQDVDWIVILRWTFRKWNWFVGPGWIWLRVGSDGGCLWVRYLTVGFHKTPGKFD